MSPNKLAKKPTNGPLPEAREGHNGCLFDRVDDFEPARLSANQGHAATHSHKDSELGCVAIN